MVYALLIYCDENDWVHGPPEQVMRTLEAHKALEDELRAARKFRGGGGLGLAGSARTVRLRAGRATVTDGPFAETKEQLGGFYLVEVEDVEEALAYARRIPGVDERAIEVRPMPHQSPA
jgi:hypothetical protein